MFIQRDSGISLEKWRQAVEATAGVQEDAGAASATNPATGEVISIPGREGDVAVQMDGKWVKAFHWEGNRATVYCRGSLERADHPVLMAAARLAAALFARIIGEEGEPYSWD